MRLLSLFLLLSFIANKGVAQNLVVDPGFEERSYCPTKFNQQDLRSLKEWKQASEGTPDHYDACSQNMGVPKNFSGYQEAFEGEAYAGLILFTPSKRNYREYIQSKLSRKLDGGELVCIEVHLSHSEASSYVCDGFGVHLSKDMLRGDRWGLIPVEMQLENPRLHILDNTDEWTLISDVYEAQGGEEYITLGNFRTDSEMKILRRTEKQGALEANDWSYVYVDDVRVTPIEKKSDCSCMNDLIRAEVQDPPVQLEESFSIRFDNVLFNFDESDLTINAEKELNNVARQLKRKPELYLEVIGHTDIIGRVDYNLDLSRERAERVIEFLLSKGVSDDRLILRYHGSEKPVAENETEEGRLQNRRVEFEVRQKRYLLHQ